ncbi:MAG: mechanosensitive ion channel family protein [Candidatus Levyibacteriota bacterium]
MNLHGLAPDSALIKTFLQIGLTLLIAVLADNILRSLIRVPKHFDNRSAKNFAAFTKNFISIVVYIICGYIILTIFKFPLGSLLASASIIGVVIGIGARSTIEDFVNGLFLLSSDSMIIGDYIKVGETEGYVERISARTLAVKDLGGAVHIIPNGQIKELINYSRNKINILIDLPVKTNQNVEKVLTAANEALHELKEDPEYMDSLFPGSEVNGIDDFIQFEKMTVRVTLTTYPARRWEVGRRYRYLVKKAFEKHKLAFV